MLLTREHVQRIVNEKAATPFAQRNFLNTLRAMFKWAAKEGRIPDDPTLGVTREKVKTTGYKTWSEDQIARFEATHPIGSKARLAFALLLYTGQRRSDVVKMGRQHIHNGVLTIDQGKTEGGEEAHLEIPVHPKLREIIDATPTVGVKTFLVTHLGKPYTAPGFGNWFRELCDQADVPTCRRMACARRRGGVSPRSDAARTKSRRSRSCLALRGAALHQGGRPQAHGARGDGEARRGRMVNKTLSSMGIMLDNFGAKALKANEPNQAWWAREDSNLQPDRYERGNFSERSLKSRVFRHANQRMFTIGCRQSLAKRWLDACVMALLGIIDPFRGATAKHGYEWGVH